MFMHNSGATVHRTVHFHFRCYLMISISEGAWQRHEDTANSMLTLVISDCGDDFRGRSCAFRVVSLEYDLVFGGSGQGLEDGIDRVSSVFLAFTPLILLSLTNMVMLVVKRMLV